MKPRYNLRAQTTKPLVTLKNKKRTGTQSNRITKKYISKSRIKQKNRRHSLRLTSIIKESNYSKSIHIPKWCDIENENDKENSLNNNETNHNDDDCDRLLARHQRLLLEEQKDRKLYERYVRGQQTLRRLQCRRTHTAHLTERTRNRLIRELERERRDVIHDKICSYLADHRIVFRHKYNIQSKQSINWSDLEHEIPLNRNIGTIHELDVMIDNLRKAMTNAPSSTSKPRLSVRERQNQRAVPKTSDVSKTSDTHSSATKMTNMPSPVEIMSNLPRVPIVRFIDGHNSKIRASNAQHLSCIQNVLLHHNNEQSNINNQNRITINDTPAPISNRKLFLRQKSVTITSSETSTKKRTLEKENCNIIVSTSLNTNVNSILRTTSPMVSIKNTAFSSSIRSYPNTRKHPINYNSLATRRQTRLSGNT